MLPYFSDFRNRSSSSRAFSTFGLATSIRLWIEELNIGLKVDMVHLDLDAAIAVTDAASTVALHQEIVYLRLSKSVGHSSEQASSPVLASRILYSSGQMGRLQSRLCRFQPFLL